MLVPSARRLGSDRHDCAHFPDAVSFTMAALNFWSADLPFTGSFSSQTFSSKSLPPKSESASLAWHLITARMAPPKALPSASPHFSVDTLPAGTSLDWGTQPVSSLAHETPDPPWLQSKRWPGPGGAARATADVSTSMLPRASPTRRVMLFSVREPAGERTWRAGPRRSRASLRLLPRASSCQHTNVRLTLPARRCLSPGHGGARVRMITGRCLCEGVRFEISGEIG